jgi:hypothetical protein
MFRVKGHCGLLSGRDRSEPQLWYLNPTPMETPKFASDAFLTSRQAPADDGNQLMKKTFSHRHNGYEDLRAF